jgi:TRAP-type mannitol/chloroaromatic compound transport system permease large subunit
MAPIMFGALVVFLLVGYPVAFALAANGIFFGLIGIELGLLDAAVVPGTAGPHFRHHEQRHAAGDSRSSPSWA